MAYEENKKEAEPFATDRTDHGETPEEEEREPIGSADDLRLGPPGPPFGIVINGHSLVSKLPTTSCTIF